MVAQGHLQNPVNPTTGIDQSAYGPDGEVIDTRSIPRSSSAAAAIQPDEEEPETLQPGQGLRGRGKRKKKVAKEAIPTNKPILPYFDIANDPYFIKAS